MLYPTELQAQTVMCLGYMRIVCAMRFCCSGSAVVVVNTARVARTDYTLVATGNCCSGRGDGYLMIFQRDERQVKRRVELTDQNWRLRRFIAWVVGPVATMPTVCEGINPVAGGIGRWRGRRKCCRVNICLQ